MTEGSIVPHLASFAVPLMFGNLFQQLYNAVDTWVVGNYVSNEAFSAMNGSWNTTKKTAKAFGASPVSTCSTYNTGCPGGCCNSPTTCSTASTADAYSGTTTP